MYIKAYLFTAIVQFAEPRNDYSNISVCMDSLSCRNLDLLNVGLVDRYLSLFLLCLPRRRTSECGRREGRVSCRMISTEVDVNTVDEMGLALNFSLIPVLLLLGLLSSVLRPCISIVYVNSRQSTYD